MNDTAPVLSIIIPTYNRTDLLTECLNKLKPEVQQTKERYEIVVSDDSTNEETKILVKNTFRQISWTEGPRRGPAANRNNGARNAVGEWLVFIDDDCIPASNILSEYKKAIDTNPSIKVFEGCTIAGGPSTSLLDEAPINTSGGKLWSCNFMIERNFFLDVLRGFDEHFPFASMEDVDLHYRIQKSGEEILFVNSAVVAHPWREQRNLLEMTKKRFQSYLYFVNKFPEKREQINGKLLLKKFYRFFVRGILTNLIKFKTKGFITYFHNFFYDLHLHITEDRQFRNQ